MKEKSLLNKLIANPIVQTIVIFVSGGWIVLEITEYLIVNFGLNEIARNILLIILISLLPIAVFLVWFSSSKKADKDSRQKIASIPLKKRRVLQLGILILIAFVTSLGLRLNHKSKLDTALNHTLTELNYEIEDINISDGERNWIVYNKAIKLKKILKSRPEFHQLWNDITVKLSITTDPKKAKVYGKPYSKPDTPWKFLGETPLLEISFPRGLSRIKIEKPGFEVQYDILYKAFGWGDELEPRQYQLFRLEEIPENMVCAQGFKGDWYTTGSLPIKEAGDFWIDRFEVTNKQYKTFLDSGGYSNSSYWEYPILIEGDTISFNEAKKRFIDNTGWTGPSNWELGEFLNGTDDLPVTGISWYEAAAYAKFVKKSLPTLYHWLSISEAYAASEIVKFGNFDKKGPAENKVYNSMTRFGTYDLPGNVSEWIFNSTSNDRFILGGNFKEPIYWYSYPLQIPPWSRNELTGFRCIRYIDDTLKQQLTQNFEHTKRDYTNLKPVSDEIFQVYKELFEFEKTVLNPVSISKSKSENWTLEIISVDVPYENAPMKILIFLPVNSKPPFQTIVYFPGLGAIYSNTLGDMNVNPRVDFFLKSGRAVIWPVYYATYGRGETKPINLHTWKQVHKNIMTDFQITCDYLQTNNDIDSEKLAYYGVSWGGALATYILAVEERIKLGILALFGVSSIEKYRYKEFDQIDYVPRIKIPMLLLGGRYDFDYLMEQQQAFYDFLGTPESNKKWIVYESSHYIPRKDLINESLNWLDKYFGPVIK